MAAILVASGCDSKARTAPESPDATAAHDAMTLQQPPHAPIARTCDGAPVLGHPRSFPDAGPCDDSPPLRRADGGDARCRYVIDCEPQAHLDGGCGDLPNDLWGANALRRCPSKERYPEGCRVLLPSGNPFYVGSGQSCVCGRSSYFDAGARWQCPL